MKMPNTLNILLVEDDEVDAIAVRRASEKARVANPLCIAGNGIEALEMLRNGEVPKHRRLVLLDLDMPRMNAFEFLREVRKDAELCRTPVVVLTTSAWEGDDFDSHGLNIAGYLVKPVTFEKLCDLLVTLNKYWTLVELP